MKRMLRIGSLFCLTLMAAPVFAQAPTTYEEALGVDPSSGVLTFATAVGALMGVLALIAGGALVFNIAIAKMGKYGRKV